MITHKRAAAYIRVSTQEQKMHGLSLDAQTQKLQDYASAHNMEIVEWYKDEGVSGQKLIKNRPELQRMIHDAQSHLFEQIIFIKLDRFFRSVGEYYKCMEMIGDIPWTATEEQYDLTTANGKMLVNMKLTIAQLEAEQTSERIKMVNEYKVRSGLPVVPTRSMPFCFARDGRTIIHRNEEAMLDLVSHFEETGSIRGTMEYINQRYGLNLLYRSVSAVLRNPMICGTYRNNAAYCQPYISRERFDRIQDLLSRHTRTAKAATYIFNGLIACPECGHTLNGTQHRTTVKGTLYSYSVYRCPAHRRDKTCSFATIVFESRLEHLLVDHMNREAGRYLVAASAGQSAIRKQDTTKLKNELSRINYAWEKGRLTPEEYDEKYEALTAKIRKIEESNAKMEAPPKFIDTVTEGWEDVYWNLSNEGKSSLWKSVVRRIDLTWTPGRYATKEISGVEYL